jgi:hypothetical protein
VREFCTGPGAAGYQDAFRLLSPDALEYSWVVRTGDGSFPRPGPAAGRSLNVPLEWLATRSASEGW